VFSVQAGGQSTSFVRVGGFLPRRGGLEMNAVLWSRKKHRRWDRFRYMPLPPFYAFMPSDSTSPPLGSLREGRMATRVWINPLKELGCFSGHIFVLTKVLLYVRITFVDVDGRPRRLTSPVRFWFGERSSGTFSACNKNLEVPFSDPLRIEGDIPLQVFLYPKKKECCYRPPPFPCAMRVWSFVLDIYLSLLLLL